MRNTIHYSVLRCQHELGNVDPLGSEWNPENKHDPVAVDAEGIAQSGLSRQTLH